MTDSLFDPTVVFDAVSSLLGQSRFLIPMVSMMAVYMALFLVGLFIEAMRFSRTGGGSSGGGARGKQAKRADFIR